MPHDISWTKDLKPDEARAALDALKAHRSGHSEGSHRANQSAPEAAGEGG